MFSCHTFSTKGKIQNLTSYSISQRNLFAQLDRWSSFLIGQFGDNLCDDTVRLVNKWEENEDNKLLTGKGKKAFLTSIPLPLVSVSTGNRAGFPRYLVSTKTIEGTTKNISRRSIQNPITSWQTCIHVCPRTKYDFHASFAVTNWDCSCSSFPLTYRIDQHEGNDAVHAKKLCYLWCLPLAHVLWRWASSQWWQPVECQCNHGWYCQEGTSVPRRKIRPHWLTFRAVPNRHYPLVSSI